jgi:hypothetical protein
MTGDPVPRSFPLGHSTMAECAQQKWCHRPSPGHSPLGKPSMTRFRQGWQQRVALRRIPTCRADFSVDSTQASAWPVWTSPMFANSKSDNPLTFLQVAHVDDLAPDSTPDQVPRVQTTSHAPRPWGSKRLDPQGRFIPPRHPMSSDR